MKTISLLLPFAIALSSLAQKPKNKISDKRFSGLDTTFARILKAWHAAGFEVAVVEKDKRI